MMKSYAPKATITAVDQAVSEFFYGLSIAPHKANAPLFKNRIDAVEDASCLYVPPKSAQLSNDILEMLHSKYCDQQRDYLEQSAGLGRAITCDGATILGNTLINFLCIY